MIVKHISFTDNGERLARDLASKIGGEASRCGQGQPLAEWTAHSFAEADALIFVGAAGIAVRAIAPHCHSKAADPAVVAVDECGRYAIPLLSGHLGGANDLARRIAAVCGAVPVITTATDINGVFAVDEWAKRQGCTAAEPERIKGVSSALLAGKTVKFASDWPINGAPPRGVEPAQDAAEAAFCLSVFDNAVPCLHVVPRVGVLGVGCRRGISAESLEAAFAAFAGENRLFTECVCAAATIELKRNEAGLALFCANHGWPLSFYSAEQLKLAEGGFTASPFVASVTGVDNVCERAAVLASGGQLVLKKYAAGGVTFALALKPAAFDWGWQL